MTVLDRCPPGTREMIRTSSSICGGIVAINWSVDLDRRIVRLEADRGKLPLNCSKLLMTLTPKASQFAVAGLTA